MDQITDVQVASIVKAFELLSPQQRDQVFRALVQRLASALENAIDFENDPDLPVKMPNFSTGLIAVAWAGINHLDEVVLPEEVDCVSELWRIDPA